MTRLIATSVVRGSNQGESHGGIYLIDTETDQIIQPVDWNTIDIDWQGRGWDRGLRGLAFHKDKIYVAGSNELFIFDQNFELTSSYTNPYMKHGHEICVYGDHLFITSTGFDSILGFNLEAKKFDWALHVKTDGVRFAASRFNPNAEDGPIQLNKLHLNSVYCSKNGMFISGLRSRNLLNYNGKTISVYTSLPEGVHNAMPYKDGIIFNDTKSNTVRFESPTDRAAFRVPRFADHKLTHTELDDSRIARQGFGRGLCVLEDNIIAGGSSPSTITLYNLNDQKPSKVINLSMDIRNAIHGLEVWPYKWPSKVQSMP